MKKKIKDIFFFIDNWSSLRDESVDQNYGSCEKISDLDSNYKSSKCLRLKNSLTWPNIFGFTVIKKSDNKTVQSDETSNLKHLSRSRKNKSTENFKLKSMSVSTASSSLTSLNSLSEVISNENLSKISEQNVTNMIINYSVRLNENTKSLVLNLISLENIDIPNSVIKSKSELSVYIKIDLSYQSKTESNSSVAKTAKTRMIKSRSNPVFDETFEFDSFKFLFESDLDPDFESNEIKLVFNICNTNLFGRDQLIGQHVHFLSKRDFLKFEEKTNANNKCEYICRIFSQKADLLDSKVKILLKNSQVKLSQKSGRIFKLKKEADFFEIVI